MDLRDAAPAFWIRCWTETKGLTVFIHVLYSTVKLCCEPIFGQVSGAFRSSVRGLLPYESNVFKPAVFTPFSLVFEQHLCAPRAFNPLPTRTDELESRLPIAQPCKATPPSRSWSCGLSMTRMRAPSYALRERNKKYMLRVLIVRQFKCGA